MNFSEKVRGARAILKYSQQNLALKAGLARTTIRNIELDSTPDTETIKKIVQAFEREGIFFHANHIEKKNTFQTTFMYYTDVLNDIQETLEPGNEILIHCADDRKSDEKTIKKLRELRESGYKFRITISDKNHIITGNIYDYRAISSDYVAESEVSMIYGNKYMQHFPPNDSEDGIFLITTSKSNADIQRRQFDYWWKCGNPIGEKYEA
ncbi:MAG: helix-turn-helix transcriptional regulator [Cyclobacteriaceae bacterium]